MMQTMIRHIVLPLALFAAPLSFTTHSAHACSCVEPQPWLLSPAREGKAPLNARVRVRLPTYVKGKLTLRKHHGDEIPTKRVDSPMQSIAHVELIPDKSLEPDTRYDVAFVAENQHPSTLVFGTFVTGNAPDTQAPTAPKMGKPIVNAHRGSAMTSCAVNTPWIQITTNDARDPERDRARLLHAVWMSNAKGAIDLNGPPTAFLVERDGKIQLGRTSYCDPDEFPLPTKGTITLAIAVVDDAGNRSAVQRVNATMSQPSEATR